MAYTKAERAWHNQLLVEGLKECPSCGLSKLLEDFCRNRSNLSGRASHCRECQRLESLAYGPRNRYGITREEYDAYMEIPCEICGAEDTVLDHCHTTGKIRGALCHGCNTGLGLYKDNPERLEAAAAYLRSHSDD